MAAKILTKARFSMICSTWMHKYGFSMIWSWENDFDFLCGYIVIECRMPQKRVFSRGTESSFKRSSLIKHWDVVKNNSVTFRVFKQLGERTRWTRNIVTWCWYSVGTLAWCWYSVCDTSPLSRQRCLNAYRHWPSSLFLIWCTWLILFSLQVSAPPCRQRPSGYVLYYNSRYTSTHVHILAQRSICWPSIARVLTRHYYVYWLALSLHAQTGSAWRG